MHALRNYSLQGGPLTLLTLHSTPTQQHPFLGSVPSTGKDHRQCRLVVTSAAGKPPKRQDRGYFAEVDPRGTFLYLTENVAEQHEIVDANILQNIPHMRAQCICMQRKFIQFVDR